MSGAPPWTAERSVAPELARELIQDQFPGIGPGRIELLGVGWDNTAYLVAGEIVFRFPRRELAVALLEAETRILPRIAPRLPLAVPVPAWAGRPTDAFPWPFAGYRRVAGRTACSVTLSDADRAAAAPALGAFLAALHGTDLRDLDLPGDTLARTDFRRRMPVLRERIQSLHASGLLNDPARWLSLFEAEPPPPAARTVLVQWGDVHAGDPGLDLMVMYKLEPARARPAFEEAYGPIDERTRRMARLRAAFHAISTAWYAHSIGDADLLREERAALRFVLEE